MPPSGSSQDGLSTDIATGAALQPKIDLLISLRLHDWPALTWAIQNRWGGPASQDKRDWLAGAVSELLQNGDVADAEDLEEVLIQVMMDEFEVAVDDGSPAEVASSIFKGRTKILAGDFSELDQLHARWQQRQTAGGERLNLRLVEAEQNDDDGEDDDDDSEASDLDDNEMDLDEPPQLVSKRRVEEPEIDEDGFQKVVNRKKR